MEDPARERRHAEDDLSPLSSKELGKVGLVTPGGPWTFGFGSPQSCETVLDFRQREPPDLGHDLGNERAHGIGMGPERSVGGEQARHDRSRRGRAVVGEGVLESRPASPRLDLRGKCHGPADPRTD